VSAWFVAGCRQVDVNMQLVARGTVARVFCSFFMRNMALHATLRPLNLLRWREVRQHVVGRNAKV
jgi:hypothetical protein